MEEKGEGKVPSKPRMHKEAQIERRRLKVFALWLWDYKATEIAKICRVDVRTIYSDLEVIRTWPEAHKVTFREMREILQERINDLMKGMKADLLELKKPEARLHYACKVAMVLIEMWKKLMPTETRFEGPPIRPELTDEEFDKVREDMMKRAPNYDPEKKSLITTTGDE